MEALIAKYLEILHERCTNVAVGAHETEIVSAACSSFMFLEAMAIQGRSPALYIGLLAMGTIEIGHLAIPLAKAVATGSTLPFAVAANLVSIPLRGNCKRQVRTIV